MIHRNVFVFNCINLLLDCTSTTCRSKVTTFVMWLDWVHHEYDYDYECPSNWIGDVWHFESPKKRPSLVDLEENEVMEKSPKICFSSLVWSGVKV